VSEEDAKSEHVWPDEEPAPKPATRAKRRRLAQLVGDAALTIGMGQGLVGGRSGSGDHNRALSNAMLVGEAKKRLKKC
jgi:hypothetical protein